MKSRARWTSMCLAAIALSALALASSCGRTVFIPEGVPLRLAQPTTTRVLALDNEGRWIRQDGDVTLPEGWYIVPPSFVDSPPPDSPP